MDGVDVVVDGTDNAETRYLLNDAAVSRGVPWVYGGCVSADGRVMAVRPGVTACLRCVWPDPPAVGELPTCDTAGVLGPAAAVVASLQSIAVLKLILGEPVGGLTVLDLWRSRWRTVDTGGPRPDCPCCGRREFPFLDRSVEGGVAHLCGRDAVQVQAGDGGADGPCRAGRSVVGRRAGRADAVPAAVPAGRRGGHHADRVRRRPDAGRRDDGRGAGAVAGEPLRGRVRRGGSADGRSLLAGRSRWLRPDLAERSVGWVASAVQLTAAASHEGVGIEPTWQRTSHTAGSERNRLSAPATSRVDRTERLRRSVPVPVARRHLAMTFPTAIGAFRRDDGGDVRYRMEPPSEWR